MKNFRNAIFVDAGYVFGQGGVSLSGAAIPRHQLQLNEAEIVNQLKSVAIAGGMPLLRIYWYDGARSGMTLEQSTLANMADVKVRLGSINSAGEQKGVDSLLVTDLIDLARNQAIADAYIVTGDGDMRIAVQIAQSFGVRVHLINLEPAGVSLNPQLRQEADTVHEISKADVSKFLQQKTPQPAVLSVSASAQGTVTLQSAATQAIKVVFSPISGAELQKIKTAASPSSGIPMEYDRKVLGTCRSLLGRDLTSDERRTMRDIVLDWLKQP
jgi:NYN domain